MRRSTSIACDAPVIRIAALYRFARFDDPAAVRAHLEAVARDAGIRGTLLVASEGVNGTIAGDPEAIDAVLAAIRALPGCADLKPKFAEADAVPFHRLKVRLKAEIVHGKLQVTVAENQPSGTVVTLTVPYKSVEGAFA